MSSDPVRDAYDEAKQLKSGSLTTDATSTADELDEWIRRQG